jgi:hypothetical protein
MAFIRICRTYFLSGILILISVVSSRSDSFDLPEGSGNPAFHLTASFSETMITVDWSAIDSASAYNVYADYGEGYVKANSIPVASRQRFSLVWAGTDGIKKRVVKGHEISLYVSALIGKNCADSSASCIEMFSSDTLHTRYFQGFSGIEDDAKCRLVLQQHQTATQILPKGVNNRSRTFIKKFPCLAGRISEIYGKAINPLEEGACVPFSTIAAIYLSGSGLTCYRAQGLFINKFHSFNLIIIDNVEYILDFTADQFLPGSSPVLIPRDCCFIDSAGGPVCRNHGKVTPMYLIDRVYSADQISFSDSPDALQYSRILDSLMQDADACGRATK